MAKFVADLHSGKLHREFHHGPDPSESTVSTWTLDIEKSWLLLLMRLGAAYWMLKTKASLFELSEVFQFEKVC